MSQIRIWLLEGFPLRVTRVFQRTVRYPAEEQGPGCPWPVPPCSLRQGVLHVSLITAPPIPVLKQQQLPLIEDFVKGRVLAMIGKHGPEPQQGLLKAAFGQKERREVGAEGARRLLGKLELFLPILWQVETQGLVHESGNEWGGFQSPSLMPGACLGVLITGRDPQPPVRGVGPAGTRGHLLTDLPSRAALVPPASSPEVCPGAISPGCLSLPCVSPCLTALGSCLRPVGPPSCESGR